MVKAVNFILSLFVFMRCIEYQTLVKQKLENRQFKTEGYYIGEKNGVYNLLAFYKDGVVRYLGSDNTNDQKINEQYILSLKPNVKQKARTGWGTFEITNNTIKYDMYYPRADAPVYTRKGIILNDSTFVIKSVSEEGGKKSIKENVIYHFRQFSPKPDSTNSFIK